MEQSTINSTIEQLLTRSETDKSQLRILLAQFSELAAESNLNQIEKYSDAIQSACKRWEKEHERTC